MIEFLVFSVQAAEALLPLREPHAVVSIRTPGGPSARLMTGPATLGVLYVAFPDLGRDYMKLPESEKTYRDDELFGRKDARVILDFFLKHKDAAEVFVVHCEGGLSRSPGVAAALCKISGQDDSPWFKRKTPNGLVYAVMLEEAVERGLL